MRREMRREMRRSPTLLFAVLIGLLLVPSAALADGAATSGDVDVLAVEEVPAGPEPAPRDAEENPARELGDYGDRETPFTWAAAWLLAGLGFVGVAVMLAFYRYRVVGPAADRASS